LAGANVISSLISSSPLAAGAVTRRWADSDEGKGGGQKPDKGRRQLKRNMEGKVEKSSQGRKPI
jgi:hypothetical protein